jgi:predicted acylesterase/phospholipase RssA/CRP-like cAMP-binding protein
MSSAPSLSEFQIKVSEVLRASPVFGVLGEAVIQDLVAVLSPQHVHGGSTVVREGDPSNSMHFVISGGLRVFRRDASGKLMLYNEIRPGSSFGETGLILEQARAASVTAVRDSILAVLNRSEFESVLARHPLALNQVFVRAIYNYLRHSEQISERRHARSFVVIPLQDDGSAHEVAVSLTEAFSRMGRAHHIAPPAAGDAVQDPLQSGQQIAHQDELEARFDFLIYEAEPQATAWTLRAFRQADQVIFASGAHAPRTKGTLENRLEIEPDFSVKRMHLAALFPAGTASPGSMESWHEGRQLERIYPLLSQRPKDFDRLARFLTGTAVGVVLGGGGARGFAHVGVLRALEESGIAVDLVGGNSMGALIGAQYASGVSLDDIIKKTQEFATGGERLTLPLISLVSGKRVERDLRKMFGNTAVDGLWLPYFAATCNLTKGCTTVQDSGPLWRAVLASNSPAGLFPPVLYHGDLLVDGAILENVPVGAMRRRLGTPLETRRGNGTIIAIDVDVREDLGVDPALTRLSVWSTLKGIFMRNGQSTPGIADILYRAGHIGGVNQRASTVAQSDHYLEPPVGAYSMMSYRQADEIAEVGYHYAMKHISQWTRQDLTRS